MLKIHPVNLKYRAGKGAGTFDSHLPSFFSEWVTRGHVMVVYNGPHLAFSGVIVYTELIKEVSRSR